MRELSAGLTMALMLMSIAAAQPAVARNEVYGMHAGLALLMDVYYPERPNGYGVVFVGGSGWHASLAYGAMALKDTQPSIWAPPLTKAGYTLFAINHRAAPAFRYPAAVKDVQRAVRFIRHHAGRFRINPERLGAVGGSSGAHLLGLVAMLGEGGIAEDPDPVNRQPATLEALVLRAGRYDLRVRPVGEAAGSFMGVAPHDPESRELYARASPLAHVTRLAPSTLLLHGDSDDVVPFEQSVAMDEALRHHGVPARLVRVAGGEHGATFGPPDSPHPQLSETFKEMVAWLDQHLSGPQRRSRN